MISKENASLHHLDLSHNQIQRIDSMKNLTMLWNIYSLNLNFNHVDDIQDLESLYHIRELYLNANKIRNIQKISNTNFNVIELSGNQMENVSWIKDLELISLNLSNNKIKHIPDQLFENIKTLVELDLSFNYIKYIDKFGCNNKENFILLDLSKNELENVDFLLDCKYVREIRINGNKIRNISSKIFNIPSLLTIDLSFNPFEGNQIPFNNEIGENLNTLYLDVNSVKLFVNLRNDRISKENENYIFYKTFYIISFEKLDHVDCLLQQQFLKRNILLNLFYSYQIDNFLSLCTNYFNM
jgi:Leucine-rich repeat (LRR) protein